MQPTRLIPFVAAFPFVAFAGTPDGQTPAQETVCDAFKGDEYGLCVSYCEARDCDDPAKHAADRACEVTERKFLKRTGLSAMPCQPVSPTCTVDAQDDFVRLNDAGTLAFNVLENDVVTPATAHATVTAATPSASVATVDLATGAFSATWDGGNAITESFEYTACCDDATCDTATVTIIGS